MQAAQIRASVVLVLAAALAAGCEAKKSENPLSPYIAGPIPGVQITQPKLLEPGQGWKFKATQLPLTLLIENANTSGVRPLVQAVQIAADAGFKTIVYTRRDIPLGPNGRTAIRMADKLQLGRTYYWRAWAYDGANTGPISRPVSFEVYPPVVIREPELISPANNAAGVGSTVQLRLRNSPRSGPAGNVRYRYQVALDSAFSRIVTGNAAQPENVSAGTTLWTATGLSFNTTYYWRVQATDGEATSGWSQTWRFSTGGAPAPGDPGDPGRPCGPPYPTQPLDIVKCRRSQYGTPMTESQLLAFVRGVAHDLNAASYPGGPWGILRKDGGRNCGGYSCDIICAGQGGSQRQYDALSDAEGAARPVWNGPLSTIRVDVCVYQ